MHLVTWNQSQFSLVAFTGEGFAFFFCLRSTGLASHLIDPPVATKDKDIKDRRIASD